MKRIGLLLTLAVSLALPASAAARPFPSHIDLPNGFAPEGIAIGPQATFYTGSLSGAGIWRGSLRTGEGVPLVAGGGPFTGMKVDAFGRLWVAGGASGLGYVFDASSGAELGTFAFGAPPSTFVNDVVVTPHAAYFTESSQPLLYKVPIGPAGAIGHAETIELDPDAIGFVAGAFNLNGIEASGSGDVLIAVNSNTGALIRIDAASGTAQPIDLVDVTDVDATVVNGDGIVLRGDTLFVVRNFDNKIAVVDLAGDFSSGTLVTELEPDDVDIPTTAATFGGALYVVNARFTVAPSPSEPYWVTRVDI